MTKSSESSGAEPSERIVMSSRVRLARNLREVPFPGYAKKVDRLKALERIKPHVEALPEMKEIYISSSMDNFTSLEKQLLVERHLISREHANKTIGSGVVINKSETISVMINEEDHLRMQALEPGFKLKKVWSIIDKVDSELEKRLNFAFSPKLGYLTACPTNVGTGMRASAMLHLPALVISEQINQIIQAVNKLGLAVRGLYGEGTEASGNLFQVSNQTTLGEKEQEVMERLNKVILQIIEHEENARLTLLEKKSSVVYDQVGRAFGILTNAHVISSKETMNLLSVLKMGVDLGMFKDLSQQMIDELFIATQPAHLQKSSDTKLTTEQRDMLRAEMVRERLKGIGKPSSVKLEKKDEDTEKT